MQIPWLAEPQEGKRVALVIGNSNYHHVRALDSPKEDAREMRAELERAGFEVAGAADRDFIDLDYPKTMQLFAAFERKLADADTGLIYYSGHGVQVNGENFIVPVDARPTYRSGVTGLISVQDLLGRARRALGSAAEKTCLLLLDACRTDPRDPLPDDGDSGKGLAAGEPSHPANQPRGLAEIEIAGDGAATFIAYATTPYTVAYANQAGQRLSPFTEAIAKYLGVRGLGLDTLMRWTGETVREATRRKQRPWSHNDLTHDFYFVPQDKAPLYTMMVLGAIAGLLASIWTFDSMGRYKSVFEDPSLYFAGVILGSVVAYGVWRWGRGTLWAAAVALLGVMAVDAVGQHLLAPTLRDHVRLPRHMADLFNDPHFINTINASITSSIIFAAGCVAAAAISSKSLQRASVLSLGVAVGALMGVIYIGVTILNVALGISNDEPAGFFEMSRLYIAAAVWYALIAGCVGYGFSTYVPRSPPEIERRN